MEWGEPEMTKEEYIKAFVEGAKWWEYEKTRFTMWQSDQQKAEREAWERWGRNERNNKMF